MQAGTGLVLSGGGARGAYEAGVLCWILGDAARAGTRMSLAAVCGTSVGAIHAAFLASALDDPATAAEKLAAVWSDLEIDHVLRLRAGGLSLWRVIAGGRRGAGLFDASALARLVGRAIDWRRVHGNIGGPVGALTVTATHVPTGRPTVFVEAPADQPISTGTGGRVVVRRAEIGLSHVVASASIPLLFPPVGVDGDLFCDGGLRLNTPMGPAVRLGAERLLVIGLHAAPNPEAPPEIAAGRYPGAPFLLGKVLNAFLLDHVAQDLENLERVNRLLADAEAAGGPGTLQRMAHLASARQGPVFRPIPALALRPSTPLGELATPHLRGLSWAGHGPATRALLRALEIGEGSGGDLASYLLFDRRYTRELLDLGRADAARHRDEIRAFLYGA